MRKKRLEFFQKAVIAAFAICVFIVAGSLIFNFVLLWNEKQPAEQEVIAAITTFGGIFGSITAAAYSALQAVRSWSKNKHIEGEKIKGKSGGVNDE